MARRRTGRTTGDVALEIIGDLELVAKLTLLGRTEGGKIARRAVRQGLNPIVDELRSGLPPVKSTRRVRRGKSRRRRAAHSNVKTRRSIGKAFRRGRSSASRGTIEAKAGFQVGKKRRSELAHVHLRFSGTKQRRHKSGKGTGRVVPVVDGYARKAGTRAARKVTQTIAETTREGLTEFFNRSN